MTFISKLTALVAIGVLLAPPLAMAQAIPGQEGGSGATQGAVGGSAAGTNANSNPSGTNHEMGKSSMGQTSNTGDTSATNPRSTTAQMGGQSSSNNR